MNHYETKPSLEQVRKLAAIGASSPTDNTPRRLNERTGGFFAVDKLDSIIVRGEDEGIESIRHSMGVHLGKRAVDVWRLEYFDTYRVERPAEQRVRAVTKYEFEWDEDEVLLARRAISLKKDDDHVRVHDLGDEILRFYLPDDAAAFLDAQLAFEEVSHDDCDQLIGRMAAYYAQVSAVNRQSVS